MWEQIHIFFDVTSAVGTIVISILTLYIRSKFLEMKDEIMESQAELLKALLNHGGKCDAERAELFRTTQRIETYRDFNDKRT